MSGDVEISRIQDMGRLFELVDKDVKLAKTGTGGEGLCPFHDEKTPSFNVFVGRDGKERYHCFGCGAQGDVLDFVMETRGVSFKDAGEIITGEVEDGGAVLKRTNTNRKPHDPYENIAPIIPIPAAHRIKPDEPVKIWNPKRQKYTNYKPNNVYLYEISKGLFGYVLRQQIDERRKITPMVMWCTTPNAPKGEWSHYTFPGPRPVYGRDFEKKRDQVLIVEGEKTADAARKTLETIEVVCWAGGTQAVEHTDWSILEGRDAIISPDNDEPGITAANEIALILHRHGAKKIRIVDVSGKPPKWDLADEPDWDKKIMLGFLKENAIAWAPEEVNIEIPETDAVEKQPARSSDNQTHIDIGSDVEIATRLKLSLLKKYAGNAVSCDGAIWTFGGSVWNEKSRNKMRREVHQFDGAEYGKNGIVKLGKNRVDSIINELHSMLDEPDFFANSAIGIACKSGLIKFDKSGEPSLEKHSPGHRCRHLIDATWPVKVTDEQKAKSLLYKLLNGSFSGDADAEAKIDLLAEVAASAALGHGARLTTPKAVVLLGDSAENGKSQVLDLIRGLLPEDAVSAIQLGKLGVDSFVCKLVGKLLNASDELTSAAAVASDAFKSVITGDFITARDLYRSSITFRPVAQHIYATNALPSFNGGMDRGVLRRLIVILFNRIIPKTDQIEHIGRRIAKEETDLLIDWVVKGATRLVKQRKFVEPPSSVEALREWAYGSDIILAWLEECVEVVIGDYLPKVRTRDAYREFRNFALAAGYRENRVPVINSFTRRVVGAGKGIKYKRISNGRYLIGLKVRNPLIDM
jgi:P4 family phage/plasmid primase-like protien